MLQPKLGSYAQEGDRRIPAVNVLTKLPVANPGAVMGVPGEASKFKLVPSLKLFRYFNTLYGAYFCFLFFIFNGTNLLGMKMRVD